MFNRLMIEAQNQDLIFCAHISAILTLPEHDDSGLKGYAICARTTDKLIINTLGSYSTQKQVDDVYQKLKNFLLNATSCEYYGHLFVMPADEGKFYPNSEWDYPGGLD